MIDPRIALGYQAPQVAGPLEAYGQLVSLKQLGQRSALADAQLKNAQLGNQQTERVLADQRAIDDALKLNTIAGPDGTPQINHAGVVKALAQGGHGQAAVAYQGKVITQQKEQSDALKSRFETAQAQAGMGTMLLQGVRNQATLDNARKAFQAWGLDEAKLPQVYDEQAPAAIESAINSGLKASDYLDKQFKQITAEQGEKRVAIEQKNAATNETRANNEKSFHDGQLQNQQNRNQLEERKAGETARHNKASEANQAASNQRQSERDAKADDRETRQNASQVRVLEDQEAALHRTRLQLGQALKEQKYFVDRSGRVKEFSSDKKDEMADMQARYDAATDELPKIIDQKNEAYARMGKPVAVSAGQAKEQLKGKPAAAAAQPAPSNAASAPVRQPAQQELPEGTVIKNKAGQRMKLVGGKWQAL